jgi:hypothetical protein
LLRSEIPCDIEIDRTANPLGRRHGIEAVVIVTDTENCGVVGAAFFSGIALGSGALAWSGLAVGKQFTALPASSVIRYRSFD